MLVFGGKEESSGLWVAKVLLLFKISVRKSNEKQEYAFLPYIAVTSLTDTLERTLGCVSLRWSIENKVYHSLKRGADILEQEGLSVVK